MGFAYNRTTWRDIVHCANHFCTYDDYNWDWSLQHVSQQCLHSKLHAMVVKGPRVFHIGEWSVISIFQMQIEINFPDFFYFNFAVAFITRKRIVNRIRWSRKCNRCYALRQRRISCIQSIWHWRWPVSWKRLNYVRATVDGAINVITIYAWMSHGHRPITETIEPTMMCRKTIRSLGLD